eukprot:m.78831 g.78831  ORF g.78831 m.78831 type:complete len:302 (-) comp50603_c0_seq1:110-1015(-)
MSPFLFPLAHVFLVAVVVVGTCRLPDPSLLALCAAGGELHREGQVCAVGPQNPRDPWLALGDVLGNVLVVDALTGGLVQFRKVHNGIVTAVNLSPSDDLLLTTSTDGSVASTSFDLQSVELGMQPSTILVQNISRFGKSFRAPSTTGTLLLPDQRTVVVASADRTLKAFDFTTGACAHVFNLPEQSSAVMCLTLHPQGSLFATVDTNGHVCVWNAVTLHLCCDFFCADFCYGACFMTDAPILLIGNSHEGGISAFDCDQGRLLEGLDLGTTSSGYIVGLSYSYELPKIAGLKFIDVQMETV